MPEQRKPKNISPAGAERTEDRFAATLRKATRIGARLTSGGADNPTTDKERQTLQWLTENAEQGRVPGDISLDLFRELDRRKK